jgi:hypothetical protein
MVSIMPFLSRLEKFCLLSFSVRVELSEQAHVIVHSLKRQIVKLKRVAIAFLHETIIDCVCFSEATIPVLFIVTMFAVAMLTDKDLFDVGCGILDIAPMLINIAEEESQDNALVPDIDSSEDLFTFHSRFCVNDHVLSPTVAAAYYPAKAVSEFGHFVIKGKDEPLVAGRDKVKSLFLEKILQCSVPFDVMQLAYLHTATHINSR